MFGQNASAMSYIRSIDQRVDNRVVRTLRCAAEFSGAIKMQQAPPFAAGNNIIDVGCLFNIINMFESCSMVNLCVK